MSIRMDWRFICRSRHFLAIVVLFFVGTGRAHAQASCSGVPSDPQGAVTWTPQWCEEFNAATAGPPDTTVWAFDLGNGGFGNNEIETYCGPPGYSGNPSNCPSTFSTSTSNAYLDGSGHLVIQAIDTGGTWFSARMKTQALENFQYGRIEASIQLPDTTNQGLWPAFWSLGTDINTSPWPACGETDFMEVWSTQVDSGPGPGGNRTTIHTSATDGAGVQPNGAYTFPAGQANNTAFHTYGMIWSANMQQFYIDNPLQPYYITTPSNLSSGDTWPFNLQIFLITNIAVGGTLGGTPSSSTPNPAIMMLDYVRQYQPSASVSAPEMGTPPSITVTAGATSGNTSTFMPTLTAGTGYVYFSCSTAAPKSSCAITTTDPLNKYVVNSNASESVTVAVTTTANSSGANSAPPLFFNPKTRIWLATSLMAGFLVSMVVASAERRRGRTWLYGCALLAAIICTGASCGGGSTSGTPPPNNGTPPGSYTVSVYAFTESNVGNGSNSTADASVPITLTVN
ncbi:MAG TPA: glycoside hydrolase family 16 protein [Terriglobales bacterium]|jgi:beta-glucanase (GH16 family)|nr:glycoside hydrolase family 16 protein [Terriglobales bacterium]